MENLNLNERFRFTMSVDVKGRLSFSSIGMHTLAELIGCLQVVSANLEKRMMEPNAELVTDFTGERGR